MKTKTMKRISFFLLITMLATLLIMPVSAQADTSPNPIPGATQDKEDDTELDVKPFELEPEDVVALYTAESGMFTVSPVRSEEDEKTFATVIGSLGDSKPAHLDERDAALSIEASFLLIRKDGARVIYTLNQNNRLVVNGVNAFTIPAEAYQALNAIYAKKTGYSHYLQWLIYMSPSNVTDITYDIGNGEVSMKEAGYLNDALQLIRGTRSLSATSQKSYDLHDVTLSPGNGTTLIKVYFKDDITYNMHFVGNTLYLEASDYRIGRQYTTPAGEGTRLLTALQTPEKSFAKEATEDTAA